MPAESDRVSVAIEGHLHRDWTRFSLDSDLFTPADAWSVSLGIPAAQLPGYVRPWAKVEVRVGDNLALTGRVDSLRRRIARDGLELSLSGRDGAGILLDCSAPVFTQREVAVDEVCASMVRPLGVDKIDVQPGGAAFKKVSIEPGMTAWEALQRAAEASGLWPWFAPDGTLRVAAPDYSRAVDAELICAFDATGRRRSSAVPVATKEATGIDSSAGAKNNVISLEMEESCNRRHSEVTVLGQSTGGEDDEAQNALRATVKDGGAWFYRPLIRDEGHVDSVPMARTRARKIITDGVFDSLTFTAVVHGHRTDSGSLWEPGMHIRLRVEKLCDISLLLARRTLLGGREGRTTTLTLKPWGVWLPDTAKKAKKRKKKSDGDEMDFDLED